RVDVDPARCYQAQVLGGLRIGDGRVHQRRHARKRGPATAGTRPMTESSIRYAAPGRINLIGEHTDYNLGFALPIALPQRTVVTLRADDGDTVRVASADEPGEVVIPLDTSPGAVTGWGAYVAGVIWALRESGHTVAGGRMSITSDIAMGSGLASSAALECAVLGAITTVTGVQLDGTERAIIAQRAENEYVGAPT